MISDKELLIRLFLSLILGGLIGLEREAHGRAAGLRTHILVCLGSTLIMLTSIHIYEMYKGIAPADPGRIAVGVVSGIGFLGAGTILRFRASVRGLTTAASLWVVAALGLAVGSGFYQAGYWTTVLALITLVMLNRLEKSWLRKDWYKVMEIETQGEIRQMEAIRKVLSDYDVEIRDFDILRPAEAKDRVILKMLLKLLTSRFDEEILHEIMKIEGIYKARWQ